MASSRRALYLKRCGALLRRSSFRLRSLTHGFSSPPMKSASILLAIICAIAIAVTALLVFEPSNAVQSSAIDHGEALEQIETRSDQRQDSMGDSVEVDRADPARVAVKGKAVLEGPSKAETMLALKANGPFLTGKVVNELGFPVGKAEVRITSDSAVGNIFALGAPGLVSQDVTDAGGGFRASRFGLSGDGVQVKIMARGFLPYRAPHRADRSTGDAKLGVMELERGIILAGNVRDAKGRPVAGATVRRTAPGEEGMFDGMMGMAASFKGMGSQSAITDEEGRFELANEPFGDFTVVATHEAFEKARLEGNAPFEGYEKLDLVLEFPASSSIAGRLSGFPTGKKFVKIKAVPIQDATSEDKSGMEILLQDFTGSGYDADVNPDGSFVVLGLPANKEFELSASIKEGFMQDVLCSNSVRARAGEQEVQLDYDSGAMITFHTVDQDTGKKIAGCVVRYRWTSDADVGFQIGAKRLEFGTSLVEIGELRPGDEPQLLTFTISIPGYREHTEADVPISKNERVDLGTIKMGQAAILRVRVLEAGTGKPLSRARVGLTATVVGETSARSMFSDELGALSTGVDSERTDKDGWVELSVCSTPTGTLTIRRSGYAVTVVEDVIMPVSGWREEFVNISEGGEIDVLVLDTLGNPVDNAEVRYQGESGNDGSGKTSKKGQIKFRDLEEGAYQFMAVREGNTRAFRVQADSLESKGLWIPVKVASGVDGDLTLRIPQDTVLKGVVTAGGQPLGGATVGFVSGPMVDGETAGMQLSGDMRRFGGNDSTVTDTTGHFELKQLEPGKHRLNIQAGESVPGQYVGVELREGENNHTFEIKIGKIEGVVLDASGSPAAGARITVRHLADGNGDKRKFMRSLFGGTLGEKAGMDGTFMIKGVPTDTPLLLSASLQGHTDGDSESVTVGEGKAVRDVKISLGLGASIRVTILGEPTPFQVVRARLLEAEDGEGTQDSTKFIQGSEGLLKDLEPGRWEVWMGNRGKTSERIEVTIRAGEEGQVTLATGS